MKSLRVLLTAAGICAALSTQAVTIISDDFSDGALDTTTWQVLTPLADSQMTEANGDAVFFQRGSLVTQQDLPAALEITGRFAFTGGSYDIFNINWRSDGTVTEPYGAVTSGIQAHFAFRGGDDGDQSGQRNIDLLAGPYFSFQGEANFRFELDTYYDFKITDDGLNISLFLQDMVTPILQGSTTYREGDKLTMQNRGLVPWWPVYDSEVSLDHINIEAVGVPDSSGSFFLLGIGLGVVGLSSLARRSRPMRC